MLTELAEELKLLVRSRHPIVSMLTADEERALGLVRRAAGEMRRPLFEWSLTTGLRRRQPSDSGMVVDTVTPRLALAHILALDSGAIFLFKDLATHLADAATLRSLRDVHAQFSKQDSTLVLVDAAALPESARRLVVPFDVSWPAPGELEAVVRQTYRDAARFLKVASDMNQRDLDQMVDALRGLSCAEAARIISAAIFDDGRLDANDLPRILEAKRDLLARTGVLESVTVDVSPNDLGGLDRLKDWLGKRRDGFSERARDFGLPPPRGILLLGIQGSGKSLAARIVAADWRLPLLRLDPGVLYQRFVGETEARLRQALLQAEALAPVVLWIDEIEKAFASASAALADGGLSQRMFATLLTWMSDHRHEIFLVATANDVSALPPELLRKGRFDEVFFVDLPGPAARKEIAAIHIRKRGRDPAGFDLDAIAAASAGFGGAEIEQAIVAALYAAFANQKELDTAAILAELRTTRPLSVLMAERIAELREWAAGRCVPADAEAAP